MNKEIEYIDILLIVIGIAAAGGLYAAAGAAVKVFTPKWRILWCAPFLLCTFFIAAYGFEISMLGVYIGSIIMLAGFIKDDIRLRRRTSLISVGVILTAVPSILLYDGYRTVDYVNDFENGFFDMKRFYVLGEYKGIDWDGLYEKYLPMFEEADAHHSEVENYLAWSMFCAEFHDGHVGFIPAGMSKEEEYDELTAKMTEYLGIGDYGLSLMPLSDGRVVAVNVDESLSDMGLHNGTVVTLWDGNDPVKAGLESKAHDIMTFADRDNELFFAPLAASCCGGETVTLTFIGDDGDERTAELGRLSFGNDRLTDTKDKVNGGLDAGHFTWTEVSSDTVCLRIKLMSYDSASSKHGSFSDMKEVLHKKAAEMRASGHTNLIIDLRSNGGGEGLFVKAVAEVFSPEGVHYYCTDGLWDDAAGGYIFDEETRTFAMSDENHFVGENAWEGDPIIILVNDESISEADHMVMIMRGMENVTVMGFTESNGSAQGVGSRRVRGGTICFSGSLMLDSEGRVFVDSDEGLESGNDIDIRIPFDEEAVKAVFDDGEDYVLDYALNYLHDK